MLDDLQILTTTNVECQPVTMNSLTAARWVRRQGLLCLDMCLLQVQAISQFTSLSIPGLAAPRMNLARRVV